MKNRIFTLYFLCLLSLVFLSSDLLAQKEAVPVTAKNALYLEAGGNGIYYSINYERVFYQKGIFKSAARIGLSVIPEKIASRTYFGTVVPLEILGLIGRSRHHLEVGLGITPYYFPRQKISFEEEFDSFDFSAFIPFRIGYRYQKPEGGFFFRIGYTPALDLKNRFRSSAQFIILHGGLSIGKSF